MYCQDCNTGNSVDSKYCKECGTKINSGYRTMMLSIQDLPLHQSDEDVEKLTRLLDMAFWHNQAGNHDAAITACEAALSLNPNSTTAHSLLGTLYEKRGEDEKAIHHFEAVLALNPESQADAQKLEQLRRGVHVRATAPPVAHQWLPPVFLKLGPTLGKRLASLSATPLPENLGRVDPQRRPLYAAGAATVVVLLGGLLLTHPWAQADTVKTYPVTAPAAPPPVSVAQSGFGTQTAAPMPPVVMMPGRANMIVPSYVPPALTARDPFAGHVPAPYSASSAVASAGAGSPQWSLPPVPRTVVRRSRGMDLPPLRLAALPPAGSDSGIPGGIAPAPISLPPGIAPSVLTGPAVAAVPRHTVVVGNFSSAPAPSAAPYQSDLSSHIRITVHQSHDDASSSAIAPSMSVSGSGDEGQGSAYQQRALSLQESGSYPQAKQAYQSAIRSYQTQIAAGRDVETAQRGLAACQTGLQICQQSQP